MRRTTNILHNFEADVFVFGRGEIHTAEAAAPAAAAAAALAAAASMMLSINRLHVSYQQVQLIGEVSILQNLPIN